MKETSPENCSAPVETARGRVLFYTHTARAFRATLIGFLSEISSEYPVVLLSEKLDPITESLLEDRRLFSKLERIVPVGQFSGTGEGVFSKNLRLKRLALSVISGFRPEAVVAASDMHSLFEMYLFRFAKSAGAVTLSLQPSMIVDNVRTSLMVDLTNAELRFWRWLPRQLRLFFVTCRKWTGHFFYHWVLPATAGTRPLTGPSSYILHKGNSGMRDSDAQIVLSERDFESCRADEVSEERLYIVDHPVTRSTKEVFDLLHGIREGAANPKNALILLPSDEVGIRRVDMSVISAAERNKTWMEIIRMVYEKLAGWHICVKPHPDAIRIAHLKDYCAYLPPDMDFTAPDAPIEKYLSDAAVVIDMPRSSSTVLWMAAKQYPDKKLISLDFDDELCGNVFERFERVEYLRNKQDFSESLGRIYRGGASGPPEGSKETSLKYPSRHRSDITSIIKELRNGH